MQKEIAVVDGRPGFYWKDRFVPVFAGGDGTGEGGGTGDTGQDSGGGTEQDSGSNDGGEQDSSTDAGSGSNSFLEAELARARKEAAQYRTRAKEVEGKAQTDIEKANARIAELEETNKALLTERDDRLLRLTVAAKARDLNFVDPDDALSLIEKADLLEDGVVNEKEIEKRLRKLAEKKSYLTTAKPKTSSTAPAGGNRDAAGSGEVAPGYGRLVSAYSKTGG